MAMNTPETGMKQTDSPKVLEKKFAEMHKRLDTPENAKREEYIKNIKEKADKFFERLPVKGGAVLMRIEQMQNDPDGAEGFDAAVKTLLELYTDAVEMRAEMFPDTMRKALKIEDPNVDIESDLTIGLDVLTGHDSQQMRTLGEGMEKIASGLGEKPADVLGGSSAGKRYWKMNDATGFPDVLQAKVHEDEKFLLKAEKDIGATETMKNNPRLQDTINKLKLGIAELKKVNPMMTGWYQWQTTYGPRTMDTKPLRVLGLISGFTVAGLGLGHSLYTGKDLTWPTGAWGILAALCAYPNLKDSILAPEKYKRDQTMAAIEKYNTPAKRELISNFTPESFNELIDIPKKELQDFRKKMIRDAKNGQTTSLAEIGRLTDGKETPLYTMLSNLNSKKVAATIDLVLGAKKDDLPFIQDMIKPV